MVSAFAIVCLLLIIAIFVIFLQRKIASKTTQERHTAFNEANIKYESGVVEILRLKEELTKIREIKYENDDSAGDILSGL